MLEKIVGIEERYEEINQLLMEVGDNYQRAAELSKERADIEPLVQKTAKYRQVLKQLEEAQHLLDGEDEELRELAQAEINELEPQKQSLEAKIKGMLLPKDPRDERNDTHP